MSESTIRAKICSILAAVTNIGLVHDYERWQRSYGDWLALFRTSGVIKGWTVRRVETTETVTAMGPIYRRTYVYQIDGLMALDDAAASGKAWDVIIEAICAAFRVKPTLEGVADTIMDGESAYGIQVHQVGVDDFDSETLFHIASLRLTVSETLP